MNEKKCEICLKNFYKYKCPKCGILYCSINCFKEHKEKSICSKKSINFNSNSNSNSNSNNINIDYDDLDDELEIIEDDIPKEKIEKIQIQNENPFEKIKNSENIKLLLENKNLQDLILFILHKGKEEECIKALNETTKINEDFEEFIELLLKETGYLSQN